MLTPVPLFHKISQSDGVRCVVEESVWRDASPFKQDIVADIVDIGGEVFKFHLNGGQFTHGPNQRRISSSNSIGLEHGLEGRENWDSV